MHILNSLADAAAVLLLVELLVILFVFLAIAGGLGFGLTWGRRKLHPLFDTVNAFLPRIETYTLKGTNYAAKPFILATAGLERVKATAEAIRRQVHAAHTAVSPVDATTVKAPMETTTVMAPVGYEPGVTETIELPR